MCEARHSTLQSTLQRSTLQSVCPSRSATPQSAAMGSSPIPEQWAFQIPSASLHARALQLPSPGGISPVTHPTSLLIQVLISSSAHHQAGGCYPLCNVSQHSAAPPPRPTALLYTSPYNKKCLSLTPTIFALAVEVTGCHGVSGLADSCTAE